MKLLESSDVVAAYYCKLLLYLSFLLEFTSSFWELLRFTSSKGVLLPDCYALVPLLYVAARIPANASFFVVGC